MKKENLDMQTQQGYDSKKLRSLTKEFKKEIGKTSFTMPKQIKLFNKMLKGERLLKDDIEYVDSVIVTANRLISSSEIGYEKASLQKEKEVWHLQIEYLKNVKEYFEYKKV